MYLFLQFLLIDKQVSKVRPLISNVSWSTNIIFLFKYYSKKGNTHSVKSFLSKSHYTWRSVSQSVRCGLGPLWNSWPYFNLWSDSSGFSRHRASSL